MSDDERQAAKQVIRWAALHEANTTAATMTDNGMTANVIKLAVEYEAYITKGKLPGEGENG